MHQYAAVPEVSGIDLTFRPRTYFMPQGLGVHHLGHVLGSARRELVRNAIVADEDVPSSALEQLEADARREWGLIHPAFMGGEYLPPLEPDEVEIACIRLASATGDQISVRARPIEDRIGYRIVDEYGEEFGEEGPNYDPELPASRAPLSMGELVRLIDGACRDDGAVFFHLNGNYLAGADIESLERFVSVSSEYYPQLGAYYAERIAEWIQERRPELDPDDDEK